MKGSIFISLTMFFGQLSLLCLTFNSWAQTGQVRSGDGVQIVFETKGTGQPALVFVHGWSCDRSYWRDQINFFSKKYQVVAIDLAGHGASGMERTDYPMRLFGSDVAAVVDQLRLRNALLIGHSMGSDVIAEAALQLRKGTVAAIIMVDRYETLDKPNTKEQVRAFREKLAADFPTEVSAYVRSMFPPGSDSLLATSVAADMSSAPPSVALSAVEHTLNHAPEMPSILKKLRLPVVAINAENGPTDIESMNRHGVDVVIMKGVGHFLMMEDPQGFNRILDDVVKKLARPH